MDNNLLKNYIIEKYIDKWQRTVDIMAKIYGVSAGVIMQQDNNKLEILVRSNSQGNIFKQGQKIYLNSGSYCEEVVNNDTCLYIKNASKSSQWCNNMDLNYNMIFYYGLPIHVSEGDIFGTICIFDSIEKNYSEEYIEMLYQFRDIIEGDLNNIAINYELTRKNKELNKLKNYYKKILDILPDAVILRHNTNIEYMNESAYNLFNLSPKDLCTKNTFKKTFHPYCNDKEIAADILDNMNKNCIIKNKHQQICTLQGKKLDLDITSIPAEIYGKNYVLNFLHDITDKKKAEKLEFQLQKEKEFERVTREFLSNISHELRTPINIIYSSLQILENFIKIKNIDNIKKYINYMKKNCYRLIRFVNNLIDVIKINEDILTPKLDFYNIVELIEETIMKSAPHIKSYNMNIIFDTEVEEKYVLCDYNFIERILLNILSNAVKNRVKHGNIYVNIYNDKSNIIINIKDDGIGIPKEMQKNIFEFFQQTDKSFTRKAEGSGLGLSIVKSLIGLQNGSIQLNSEEGKGTEFSIKFPINSIPPEEIIAFETHADVLDIEEKINIEFSDIYT